MSLKFLNRSRTITPEESDRFLVASQWRLMWWKFKKHRIAVVCAFLLFVCYFCAIFCEFVSPYSPYQKNIGLLNAPPQKVRFISEEGFHLRPFVYPLTGGLNDDTWERVYEEDRSRRVPIRFFVRGSPYKILGLVPWDRHLYGTESGEPFFLLGADHLGRDVLSRIIYGSRVSLSIGIVGVFLSMAIGCIVGGISGYFGGAIDNVIQRLIETLISIPTLPLWMGLSAAVPTAWSPIKVYFGMVVILSILGWAGLARVVRGKIISLREEDFAMAARLAGAGEQRIIRKHLLPSFFSYLIVQVTLAVPGMILAETTLSYLGLGLRPPVISWGVMLQQAQNVQTVATYPWLMSPALFVIVVVLAFNFVGDGLRDAADPYH